MHPSYHSICPEKIGKYQSLHKAHSFPICPFLLIHVLYLDSPDKYAAHRRISVYVPRPAELALAAPTLHIV